MAGHGPAPKQHHQRERDTKRRITDRQITLSRDGAVRGPSIEDATGTTSWGPEARAYWQTWRTSPMAAVLEATDWQRLAMLVPLVESYWTVGADSKILSEVRLNEERLGATVADRQRLRMKIEEAQDATVTQLRPASAPDPLDRVRR